MNKVNDEVITVNFPEWLDELSFDELDHVFSECEKKAEKAWNDKMDSFERVYLARKAYDEQGQMSVYDYV